MGAFATSAGAFLAVLILLGVLYQLVKQQGRLLLRLEQIERQLGVNPGAALAIHDVPAARPRLRGLRPLTESRIERNGLKPGTPAPIFALMDTRGETVSLEQYRGRRVFLVFSDPECGPCNQLASHLPRIDAMSRATDSAVVMVARGSVEANLRKASEHGFAFPVVIQKGWNTSREYGLFATPVAFLVDQTGVIAAPAAKGVGEILTLAATAFSGTERGVVWTGSSMTSRVS